MRHQYFQKLERTMPCLPSFSLTIRPLAATTVSMAMIALSGCSAVENIWPFGNDSSNTGSSAVFSDPFAGGAGAFNQQSAAPSTTPLPGFAAQPTASANAASGFGVQPQATPRTFPDGTIDPNGSVGRYQIGPSYTLNGAQIVPRENLSYRELGMAGWYGNGFDGAVTANGEKLNSQLRTFAHRTLPFSTIARLTNTATGRSVVARVNDRGPIETDRLIDVTTRLAQELGFNQAGRAQVMVEVLPNETRIVAELTGGQLGGNASPSTFGQTNNSNARFGQASPNPPSPASSSVSAVGPVVIQAGSFSDQRNALRLQATLSPIGQVRIQPLNINGRPFWRVIVGPYASESEARIALGRVVVAGATDAILQRVQ